MIMIMEIEENEFEERILSNDFPLKYGDSFIVMKSGKVIKKYEYSESEGLHVAIDFVEDSRKSTKEEIETVKNLSDDEILNWLFNYCEIFYKKKKPPYHEYSLHTDEFLKRFRFFYEIRSIIINDDEENPVPCPNMMFDQSHTLEEHIEELEKIMSHMKYVDFGGETGKAMKFSIFEYNLAENGIYSCYICEDGTSFIEKVYYGRIAIEKRFKNYGEMVKYIIKNHPYRKIEEE